MKVQKHLTQTPECFKILYRLMAAFDACKRQGMQVEGKKHGIQKHLSDFFPYTYRQVKIEILCLERLGLIEKIAPGTYARTGKGVTHRLPPHI